VNCPQCGASSVPDAARFCPACGACLTGSSEPAARVTVGQDVGQAGQVVGLQVDTVRGSLTVERIDQSVTAHIDGEAIARLYERDRTREWLRELASQIDDAVTRFLMAIQFVEVGAASFSQADFDQAYVEWEIKREVIETVLRSHGLAADLVSRWDAFATTVSEVYALSGTYTPSIRLPRLDRLQVALAGAAVQWKDLEDIHAGRSQGPARHNYLMAWFAMRQAVMAQKDQLITNILATPAQPQAIEPADI
jgi:hypothetical protein